VDHGLHRTRVDPGGPESSTVKSVMEWTAVELEMEWTIDCIMNCRIPSTGVDLRGMCTRVHYNGLWTRLGHDS